jgi:hypothetical protein
MTSCHCCASGLYCLLVYGRWYRETAAKSTSAAAREVSLLVSGLYGSMCKGPGVSEQERWAWQEEMKMGRSTDNWM